MYTKKNVILIMLPLLAMLLGCEVTTEKEQPELIRKVKVEKVSLASSEITKTYSGIVKEANNMSVAFKVAGNIKKIYVKEGDFVEKGQLIAEMDRRDYEIQATVAQAQYDQVKAEVSRVKQLHERNSVTDNDYDKAISGEKLVTAQLKRANDQLNDTKLHSTFSGYIQKLNYTEGELIDAGMPIVSMINVAFYKVEVDVPLSTYIQRPNFTNFSCSQEKLGVKNVPLVFIGFNKKANNNQLYRLYFRLTPADAKRLAPGMNVEVDITYGSQGENPVSVPINSIFKEGDNSFVWIYKKGSGSVEKKKIVTDGLTPSGEIRIVSGLDGTEQIVVAGVNSLRNNEKVEVLKAKSKTNVGGLM